MDDIARSRRTNGTLFPVARAVVRLMGRIATHYLSWAMVGPAAMLFPISPERRLRWLRAAARPDRGTSERSRRVLELDVWCLHRAMKHSRRARLRFSVLLLVHPFLQGFFALRDAKASGPSVRDRYGLPITQQWLQNWTLRMSRIPVFSHPVRSIYYACRLYVPGGMEWAPFLLPQFFLIARDVNQATAGLAIADKLECASRLESHGLPAIPTLFHYVGGEEIRTSAADGPSGDQLFAKPLFGEKGEGALAWTRQDGDTWIDAEEHPWREADIRAHLRERSVDTPYLLQPRLRNHPEMRRLVGDTLSTIRVLTLKLRAEEPAVVMGVAARLPLPGSIVDNLSQGATVAGVDLDTGTLIGAMSMQKDLAHATEVDRHPGTGHPVAGFVLPGFEDVTALALRAHEVFDDLHVVGWDIAITPTGPVVVEGNSAPGSDVIEVFGPPLGSHSHFDHLWDRMTGLGLV